MKLFASFYTWILSLRRSGTTTLLEKIAKVHDVYILVPTEKEKRDKKWNGKAICFIDLDKGGMKPKPILLDNHAMIEFSKHVYALVTELEAKVAASDALISKIKGDIDYFNIQHGRVSDDHINAFFKF